MRKCYGDNELYGEVFQCLLSKHSRNNNKCKYQGILKDCLQSTQFTRKVYLQHFSKGVRFAVVEDHVRNEKKSFIKENLEIKKCFEVKYITA